MAPRRGFRPRPSTSRSRTWTRWSATSTRAWYMLTRAKFDGYVKKGSRVAQLRAHLRAPRRGGRTSTPRLRARPASRGGAPREAVAVAEKRATDAEKGEARGRPKPWTSERSRRRVRDRARTPRNPSTTAAVPSRRLPGLRVAHDRMRRLSQLASRRAGRGARPKQGRRCRPSRRTCWSLLTVDLQRAALSDGGRASARSNRRRAKGSC